MPGESPCAYRHMNEEVGLLLQQVIYVITGFVNYFIIALQFLMIVRALSSWLPMREDSALNNFLYAVTEPVVIPVRMLLERFDAVRNMPIDISFLVAMLALAIIQTLLPPVNF